LLETAAKTGSIDTQDFGVHSTAILSTPTALESGSR